MANDFYEEYQDSMLGAPTHSVVDMDTDNIKAALIDEGADTPDLVNDKDWVDRTVGAIIADSANLAGAAIANGAIDFTDITFTAVSGVTVESIDVRKDSGADATSPILANYDTATGLPLSPNGGDVTIQWNASGLWSP